MFSRQHMKPRQNFWLWHSSLHFCQCSVDSFPSSRSVVSTNPLFFLWQPDVNQLTHEVPSSINEHSKRVIRAARWWAINPKTQGKKSWWWNPVGLSLTLDPSLSSSFPPFYFDTHPFALSSFYPSVASRRRRGSGEFLSRIHNHLSTWGLLVCIYVCKLFSVILHSI